MTEEKQKLVDISPTGAGPGFNYGSEMPQPSSVPSPAPSSAPSDLPPPYTPSVSTNVSDSNETSKVQEVNKRDRLQRLPSLEKVDEDQEMLGCSDLFGVRSHLHHFYDKTFYKDPSIYEEDDEFGYLLQGPRKRPRLCTSIWWKVFVWIGANFLVFGIIGVLVGYLVPAKTVFVESMANNIEIVDKEAISFNFNLDVCKLVGLILFCIGGLTLTVALLFPSLLYQYCDGGGMVIQDAAFRVRVLGEEPIKSPVDRNVPATSTLTGVQPDRKVDESIVTQEGMMAME